ncbi:hypothetical protein B0T24DRAFT_712108 [Lasiosphaeria ovina]|uniref:Uncharacterized protein n=1 Tax=Lasiosphaeria ovina TaxID=92902 RepID=A0AAE0N0D7_9PEZI|nr:hypothetical protein B0T24DRAFT_712108 [Lasiosphaeria ovina]
MARLVRAREAAKLCETHKRSDWSERELLLLTIKLKHDKNGKTGQPSTYEVWRISKTRLDELVKTVTKYDSYVEAADAGADTAWPSTSDVKGVYVLCGGQFPNTYKEALEGAKLGAMIDGDKARVYDEWWVGAIRENDPYCGDGWKPGKDQSSPAGSANTPERGKRAFRPSSDSDEKERPKKKVRFDISDSEDDDTFQPENIASTGKATDIAELRDEIN